MDGIPSRSAFQCGDPPASAHPVKTTRQSRGSFRLDCGGCCRQRLVSHCSLSSGPTLLAPKHTSQFCRHIQTIFPVLSMKPHLLPTVTPDSPSEKPRLPRLSYCSGITMFPVLSMKPYFLPLTASYPSFGKAPATEYPHAPREIHFDGKGGGFSLFEAVLCAGKRPALYSVSRPEIPSPLIVGKQLLGVRRDRKESRCGSGSSFPGR